MLQKRILVAEDQAKDAFILERPFKKTDAKTTLRFVRDGQEVIDIWMGKRSSLIEMSGFRIKSDLGAAARLVPQGVITN